MKKTMMMFTALGVILVSNFSAYATESMKELVNDLKDRITSLEQRVSDLEGRTNISTGDNHKSGEWTCEVFCIYKDSDGQNEYGIVGMGKNHDRGEAYKVAIKECRDTYGSSYAGADIHFRPGPASIGNGNMRSGAIPGAADEESACYQGTWK